MDLNNIENFLQKYQLIITILLVPILGIIWSFVQWILKKIVEHSKKILINFTTQSSIENPNICFTSLEITNHKNKKIIGNKVEIVMFDENNEYRLNLHSTQFMIEAETIFRTNIKKVSHYACNSEFIDFSQLIANKQFYFNIYNAKKLIYSDRKIPFNFKKKNQYAIKTFTASFEGIIHSFGWDYGFVYKDTISNKRHIGFMNKRQIYSPHATSDILENDFFTPTNVMQIITERGGKDFVIKKLGTATDKYREIETKKLGTTKYKLKEKGTKDNPIVLTEKDILALNVRTQDL